MASFSKKTGYIITDVPEGVQLPEPEGSGKSARWRVVRGHQSNPGQNGVRLLITGARSEHIGMRGTDRTNFYRTYLTVERANDIVPNNSPKHLSARPQLDHELSFVHAECCGPGASTENKDLDALRQHVGFEVWCPVDESHTACRFVTSWATTEDEIAELERLTRKMITR